ncbi:hypothetical protein L226DRAFT_368168 [Lentinus tigrinus ALCF2SS1-7]|uniref:uncharacterized protein n=1 Tax=Lentinus tigrinus ALCF2SS1-7 TaxID=1328758 RepID=UPI001165F4F5|nr:hypothetical protein L226DRAFT_368168 [Lentinus tigrinus ALCF2SS1-7]
MSAVLALDRLLHLVWYQQESVHQLSRFIGIHAVINSQNEPVYAMLLLYGLQSNVLGSFFCRVRCPGVNGDIEPRNSLSYPDAFLCVRISMRMLAVFRASAVPSIAFLMAVYYRTDRAVPPSTQCPGL